MAAEIGEMNEVRPNIRIEIQNDVVNEEMDVDEDIFIEENEEGEITEEADIVNDSEIPSSTNLELVNSKKIFTTGINIFDKDEQDKLQERAKRFSLKPEEIHTFTDMDLKELYDSLGIKDLNDMSIRFDTLHVLGINGMTVEDILEYFSKYAPTGIEWIDKDSCNITWFENIAAARAMFYTSKAVKGMPARESVNTFAKEFLDDVEEEHTGQSILLKNRNIKIDDVLNNKYDIKNAVDISEITIPIPPGYWRLGDNHPKVKCLLLRYALRTDKKPYRVEEFTKYYKKLGMDKKREYKGIFERNRELTQDKNPWGSLAKNWSKDTKFCEPEPDTTTPEIEIKNPRLLVRLGKKKLSVSEEDPSEITENKSKHIPRMRMYADEEEENLRRKKLLQIIKRQSDKLSKENKPCTKDLRGMLNLASVTSKLIPEEVIDLDPEIPDLGTKLKNRTRRMVFTVQRDDVPDHVERHSFMHKSSPIFHRSSHKLPEEKRLPLHRATSLRRYKSPLRRRSPHHRRPRQHHSRSPERTLHSDRMYPRRKHDLYEEDHYKPKSKVAVVIKKPKQPTVASTIWSRVQKTSASEKSSSEDEESSHDSSESEDSSSSVGSETDSDNSSDSDSERVHRRVHRPGFRGSERATKQLNSKSLKITMANDRFRR